MTDKHAYVKLSHVYNSIIGTEGIRRLSRNMQSLWRKHGLEPGSILELGAGTCPFATLDIYPAGSKVVFSDLSPHMLAQAGKMGGLRSRVAADARALPVRGAFQLCIMANNAFNYLVSEEEVDKCLRETWRVLEPGGLFILDVIGGGNIKRLLTGTRVVGEVKGVTWIWSVRSYPEAALLRHTFTLFQQAKPDCWRRIDERHTQRYYPIDTFRRMAEKAGFSVEACHDHLSMAEGSAESFGLIYVLRKSASQGAN